MQDFNILSLVIGATVTAIATFVIARFTKAFDLEAQARATLITIGPKIIEQQNTRIDNLSEGLQQVWMREQECLKELAKCRQELSSALNRISALEKRS